MKKTEASRPGTAKRIAVAAGRLLAEEGAKAITMRRVAGVLGVTAMALYRHYPDRDGLLNALADDGFADLSSRLERAGRERDVEKRVLRLLEIYLDHALEHPKLFELMFLERRAGARQFPRDFQAGASPTANLLVAALREGMDAGRFRRDDEWEIGFALGALSHGLLLLHLHGRTDLDERGFRRLYRRSVRRYLDGLRAQQG